MAEATVTIKLTPQEFDIVRDSLVRTHQNVLSATSASITPDAAERQKLRAEALLLHDLGKKLGA
jgi:flagellar biosynthesis/type III secretory pathway protein FliH